MRTERRARIIEAVNRQGMIAFADLTAMFPEVSEMTLRKDLKSLDQDGRIVRIHGGARSLDTVRGADLPLNHRLEQNIAQKKQIAAKARTLLSENASIFLDSGSTMTELAKMFVDQPCLVFTGGLSCANELSRLERVNIYLLGGMLNKSSLSVRDMRVANDVNNLFFDVAFISVNGFSEVNGFSCRSPERCEMEKAVLRRSARVVVAMDSTKVGKRYPFSICAPQEIDLLISDDALPSATREALEAAGVQVL